MVVSETIMKIINFLKNLTGIKWIMVIDKSKDSIIYTHKIISDDLAHSIGSLIIDISKNIRRLRELIMSFQTEINDLYSTTMCLRQYMIEMKEYLNYIFVFYGDSKVYHAISDIFYILRKGKSVRCYSCGNDLTLATYICPKCGRTIPFVTSKCPYCNSSIKIKKCPYCNALINSINGQKIYRNMVVLLTSVFTGLIIISSSIYMSLTSTPPMWDIAIIGSLIGALMIYIGSRIFYKTY